MDSPQGKAEVVHEESKNGAQHIANDVEKVEAPEQATANLKLDKHGLPLLPQPSDRKDDPLVCLKTRQFWQSPFQQLFTDSRLELVGVAQALRGSTGLSSRFPRTYGRRHCQSSFRATEQAVSHHRRSGLLRAYGVHRLCWNWTTPDRAFGECLWSKTRLPSWQPSGGCH